MRGGGVGGQCHTCFKQTLSSDANLRSAAEGERSNILRTLLQAPAANGETMALTKLRITLDTSSGSGLSGGALAREGRVALAVECTRLSYPV